MKLSIFYIRSMARGLMRQNYGTCMASMGILLVITLAFSVLQQTFLFSDTQGLRALIVTLLLSLLSLAILSPANVGSKEVLCDVASSRETKAGKVLAWYGDARKIRQSILLQLLQSVIFLCIGAVFGLLIFGGAYLAGMDYVANLQSTDVQKQLEGLMQVYQLMFLTIVPSYLVAVPFLPAPYLLAQQPEKKPWSCIRESRRLVRGHYWKYVGIQMLAMLQFLGYAILISVVCSIFSGGDLNTATTSATLLAQLVLYFSILPHLDISTALFLNDVRVRNQVKSEEMGGESL